MPRHWVWQGGVLIDRVTPSNRGLAYGDGLFETMRVEAGTIPLLSRHLARLMNDLVRLAIPAPGPELATFLCDCCRGVDLGVLKLIVTRGEGGRGYLPDDRAVPVCIISLFPFPQYEANHADEGIHIGLARMRLGLNPMLAGMKHLNRLEQVMIRRDLAQAGFVEGVVLDQYDFVVEAAFSNIFIISDKILETPLLNTAGVAGVMRGWVLEQASSMGMPVRQSAFSLPRLLDADEIFLCNSLNGIWPVIQIGEREWGIGPQTRALQAALRLHWECLLTAAREPDQGSVLE